MATISLTQHGSLQGYIHGENEVYLYKVGLYEHFKRTIHNKK